MKKLTAIGSFLAFTTIANAQWSTSGTSIYKDPNNTGNVGIGTTSPVYPIDVRGYSTFGGGATSANYLVSPYSNERHLYITGNAAGGSNSYGSVVVGSNDTEGPNQWLGGLVFGQNMVGSGKPAGSATGLKAAIRGLSTGSGGSTGGYGGNLIFCTTGDNSANIVPERMRLDMKGNVGLGTSNPAYRLHVEDNDANAANNAIASTGMYFEPTNSTAYIKYSGTSKYGVHASIVGYDLNNDMNGGGSYLNAGIGVFGKSERTAGVSNDVCVGVLGVAQGAHYINAGGAFHGDSYGNVGAKDAGNDLNVANFGIWASEGKGPAGYFNGYAYTTGLYQSADSKLQNDIKPLANTIDKLKLLKPICFQFKTEDFGNLNLPTGKQMGLNSDELEKVFPEVIKEIKDVSIQMLEAKTGDIKSFKTINYSNLIPVLIAGIQEQQVQIEQQQQQLLEQKEMINALINKIGVPAGTNETGSISVGFDLGQNVPNPYTGETTIKYVIPNTVFSAFIMIHDLSGKQVASFPLTEKGTSSITITREKLAAGIYTYSLLADGKIVDSKRMVVAQK